MMDYTLSPDSCGALQLPVVRIHLDAIRDNWHFLARKAEEAGLASSSMVAMVKADAYGHGLLPVCKTLVDAGARTFGVGSVAEGVHLHKAFGQQPARILAMLGLTCPAEAAEAARCGIMPLLSTIEHIRWFSQAANALKRTEPLPVAIKLETGMARLGVRSSEMAAFTSALRANQVLKPVMAVSHLAAADDPHGDESVREQVSCFAKALKILRAVWPDITPSLANSPAFLAHTATLAPIGPHAPRPGFAIYGGNPLASTPREELGSALLPAMEYTAPVLAVHNLEQGETVSYGKTFTASSPMRIAVIGAGYADGMARTLSGKGFVCLHSLRAPVLGRVCMQMHVVDVSHIPATVPGDRAFLLGGDGNGRITPEELAAAWGTIPYEVFCILGKNAREYLGGA